MNNDKMLGEAPIGKLLLKMCVPTIVIMLVIVAYNMADIYFIGQTGDAMQVAAISLSGPVFSILQALGTLLDSGGCTAIATQLGRKDFKSIRSITSFCCWSCIAIGIVFAIVVLTFIHPITAALGASSRTAQYTAIYLRILALGAPAIIFSNVFANLVRRTAQQSNP